MFLSTYCRTAKASNLIRNLSELQGPVLGCFAILPCFRTLNEISNAKIDPWTNGDP